MSELIDLNDLDFTAASERPHTFCVKGPTGNPTPLHLSVLGDNAEAVQKFNARRINEKRREAVLRAKSRRNDEFEPFEEDIEFVVEAAAVRVVDWSGAAQKFDREMLRKLLRRNPHIREQVMEQSANVGNFTQS